MPALPFSTLELVGELVKDFDPVFDRLVGGGEGESEVHFPLREDAPLNNQDASLDGFLDELVSVAIADPGEDVERASGPFGQRSSVSGVSPPTRQRPIRR